LGLARLGDGWRARSKHYISLKGIKTRPLESGNCA